MDPESQNQHQLTDFELFRYKVLTDGQFRLMLGTNPQGALESVGIAPTPDLLAALQHMKDASQHAHQAFGEEFQTVT